MLLRSGADHESRDVVEWRDLAPGLHAEEWGEPLVETGTVARSGGSRPCHGKVSPGQGGFRLGRTGRSPQRSLGSAYPAVGQGKEKIPSAW